MRIKKVCNICGSGNVVKDAWAIWNTEKQEYELENIFDNEFCTDCEKKLLLKMKLFKNYVEVKQTMIKKKSKVVMLDSSSDADKYDITQEVLQIGPDCKFVEIGNIPIISPYFQEYGRKLVSGDSKDGDEMVFHVIYSEDDFVGVE